MAKVAKNYGSVAKLLHWLAAALMIVQYLIGWLMPDIHGGMKPRAAMTLHVSFGVLILVLMTFRLIWRLANPVAPDRGLPTRQRFMSEFVHWLLYILVFVTTLSGWLFASARGWTVVLFYTLPLPILVLPGFGTANEIDGLHQIAEWSLLVVIGMHVGAALAHACIYGDRILQRMLPGNVA